MTLTYLNQTIDASTMGVINVTLDAGTQGSGSAPKGVESFKLNRLGDFIDYKTRYYGSVTVDWNVSLSDLRFDETRYSKIIDQLELPSPGWWCILHKGSVIEKGTVLGVSQTLGNYRFADSPSNLRPMLKDSPNAVTYSGYGAAGVIQTYQDPCGKLKGDELLLYLEPGVGCQVEFALLLSRISAPPQNDLNSSVISL